mgnify:CR=1 FL=1
MTFEQAAIILLLVTMLVVFAVDRWRMEVVALAGLGAGVMFGLVPITDVFSGFANPAVITVIEILLIVQVLARTQLLDDMAKRILGLGRSPVAMLAALCGLSALLSVFMNNIGALALMIPVASSVCRTASVPLRLVMMPIAFAALLGGLCSVVGTPANLIVSQQLWAATGHGFAFFDYAWAGVPAVLAGLAAIVLWAPRVLPGPSLSPVPQVLQERRAVEDIPQPNLAQVAVISEPADAPDATDDPEAAALASAGDQSPEDDPRTPLQPVATRVMPSDADPLVAGVTPLSRHLRDNDVTFTGMVLGPVSHGVFRSINQPRPMVVAIGQELPDTQIVLTDLRGQEAEFTLADATQSLTLDLRR